MKFVKTAGICCLFSMLLAAAAYGQAQHSNIKGKTIQASSMGTGTQMGRLVNINVIVEKLSTAEERQGLIEAFAAKGNEGLVNALEKMKAKGRIAVTGTL